MSPNLLYRKISIFICFACIFSVSFAQQDSSKHSEIQKTGWNFGLLPVVAYNTDLGLQYGMIVSPFYYGNGSSYPQYLHKLYFEISRYTKGSGIYRFYYQSKYLLPGINTIADISYLPDLAYDFYGFNGRQTIFHEAWIDPNAHEYAGSYFYDTQRKFFRIKLDFQGATSIPHLQWNSGVQFRHINFSRPDFSLINKGKLADEIIPSDSTLFDKYTEWGIIPEQDKDGGIVTSIKAGISYDTRDFESSPTKGIWTEANITASPSFMGTNTSFGRFNITHRQYLSIIPKKLTFAYRSIFQSELFGSTPFYILPEIETSVLTAATNEGLGGAASLRGILRNRIVGKQIFMTNVELRYKIVSFPIQKQNIYIATNAFFDAGTILKPIDIENTNIPASEQQLYFSENYSHIHSSVGLGLKIAMNQNFIVSIEYGKALNNQDGSAGLYIRLNYLF